MFILKPTLLNSNLKYNMYIGINSKIWEAMYIILVVLYGKSNELFDVIIYTINITEGIKFHIRLIVASFLFIP